MYGAVQWHNAIVTVCTFVLLMHSFVQPIHILWLMQVTACRRGLAVEPISPTGLADIGICHWVSCIVADWQHHRYHGFNSKFSLGPLPAPAAEENLVADWHSLLTLCVHNWRAYIIVVLLTGYSHCDVLINNAGVMCHPQATTSDSCEIHFQTNYLGL